MRIVVTGAAGFIGGAVARQLQARGDDVVAIVRNPTDVRATALQDLGIDLVPGDLASTDEIAAHLGGADGLVHLAGSYRIGIRKDERSAMLDANVGTTTRVLDAAAAAGTARIVYTSSGIVLGDTHGAIVDETHQRNLAEGFLSYYDETKYKAHQLAKARIVTGAPIAIAMPGQIYGPGDHTTVGEQLALAHAGKLPYIALGDAGLSWIFVDDVADGIVRVLDRGRLGEEYLISGPSSRLRDAIAAAARLGGRKPPRMTIPTGLLKLLIPVNRRFGAIGGLPANLAETIKAGSGVTYWLSPAKAERELGYQPRDFASGLRATLEP